MVKIRDLIPPILLRPFAWTQEPPLYASYGQAASACPDYGYEEESLVNVVYEKTKRYRDSLSDQKPFQLSPINAQAALALTISTQSTDELRVIDFGGACGAHYFLARSLLAKKIMLRWYIVETSAMVKKGRALESEELRFFNDLNEAKTDMGRLNLMFSSGALQYVEKPYGLLQDLVNSNADRIYLARLPITAGTSELVFLQESRLSENGPGVLPEGIADGIARYPITVLVKNKVEKILQERYQIQMQFQEENSPLVHGQSVNLYGYYCELPRVPVH